MKSKQAAIWVIALFVVLGGAATVQAAGKVNLLEAVDSRLDKLTVLKGLIVNGVTQFNGTMLNTTKTKGVDNPIAIGDNLRVDGDIFRGARAGADNKPVKINDSLQVTGSVSAANFIPTSGDPLVHTKVYSGTIDSNATADFSKSDLSFNSSYCKFTYIYQWKSVSVPEITIANMPLVNIYTDMSGTAMAAAADILPDGVNSWVNMSISYPYTAGLSFAEGKANIMFAYDIVRSNCTTNPDPQEVNGTTRVPIVGNNYKIVVNH